MPSSPSSRPQSQASSTAPPRKTSPRSPPEYEISFVPRTKRPRTPTFVRQASLTAFKPKLVFYGPAPKPPGKPYAWAPLFPECVRRSSWWVVERVRDVVRGEEDDGWGRVGMGPGSVRSESVKTRSEERWRFDEGVWEEEAEMESVEGRIMELGLA
ncbi:hypothetical protein CC86DRAFT_403264 [Ophiobolus disseminans]|uniref:Uncharacterized protein n=1 Tax=Ophiobolus disseminans TaxID=1469910 RepID=A0A6A7AB44_9PLEO|nr:hypothetical protein CC86DRAFT_403264 [Ophiobolus disseminans]